MAEAIIGNSSDIAALKAEVPLRTAARYTSDDAKRDQDRVGDRFAYDEQRLAILENRRGQ